MTDKTPKADRRALDAAIANPATDPALVPHPDDPPLPDELVDAALLERDGILSDPEPAAMLSTADVARRLNVDPATVRRWITSGALVAVRVGRDYRVAPAALDDLVERHRVSTPLTLNATRTRAALGGHQ